MKKNATMIYLGSITRKSCGGRFDRVRVCASGENSMAVSKCVYGVGRFVESPYTVLTKFLGIGTPVQYRARKQAI